MIDNPPVTLEIVGDVQIAAGAEVDVTPSYTQTSATLQSTVALTYTGTRTGVFANEGEHLRDGLFVEKITYKPGEAIVGLLQAARAT